MERFGRAFLLRPHLRDTHALFSLSIPLVCFSTSESVGRGSGVEVSVQLRLGGAVVGVLRGRLALPNPSDYCSSIRRELEATGVLA